ncbi:MAG: hypothetical protein U0905_20080 [Pirellulales bacterium]
MKQHYQQGDAALHSVLLMEQKGDLCRTLLPSSQVQHPKQQKVTENYNMKVFTTG